MTQEIIKADTGESSLDLHEVVSDHKHVFLPSNDHSLPKLANHSFSVPVVCNLH